jgi:hypothetical protein
MDNTVYFRITEVPRCTLLPTRRPHYKYVYFVPVIRIQRGARGSVVRLGTMLQAGRSPFRVPDEVAFFQFT